MHTMVSYLSHLYWLVPLFMGIFYAKLIHSTSTCRVHVQTLATVYKALILADTSQTTTSCSIFSRVVITCTPVCVCVCVYVWECMRYDDVSIARLTTSLLCSLCRKCLALCVYYV